MTMGIVIQLPDRNRPPPRKTAAGGIRACLTMINDEVRGLGLTAAAFLIEAAIQAIDEREADCPAEPDR